MATFSSFSSDISYTGVSGTAVGSFVNNTDHVSYSIKVYIEGVQVHWVSISISQRYQALPTATVSIPPSSGLMDITRGYEPKIHIFFEDVNQGGMRLLFWGNISASSYNKSRASGSSSISFSCVHKNQVLRDSLTLDFAGWANSTGATSIDGTANTGGAAPPQSSYNSKTMISDSLKGVSGVSDASTSITLDNVSKAQDLDYTKIDKALADLEPRFTGMPGVILNLWNQLKLNALRNPKISIVVLTAWMPLLEEGLSFFKRMSGHPVVEDKLTEGMSEYCHSVSPKESKIITPPYFRMPLISAVQSEAAVTAIAESVGFSGELTGFLSLVESILEVCKYDMQTLSSPAEVATNPSLYVGIGSPNSKGVPKMAVETIVKPRVPFYYSPVCNVVLPRMFSDISVQQDERGTPTRLISAYKIAGAPGVDPVAAMFKGPASVREAVAYNSNFVNGRTDYEFKLLDTLTTSFPIMGKYEQGRGIRPLQMVMPLWLSMLCQSKGVNSKNGPQEVTLDKSSLDYRTAMMLTAAWNDRYAIDTEMADWKLIVSPNKYKRQLNPCGVGVEVEPYQRLLLTSLDYEYGQLYFESRTAVVSGPFNPYIIPGYPMDVIDESPSNPSFHGLCTSVDHSFTSSGISTTIGMSHAMTYAELTNYYQPALPPFLMSALSLVNGKVDEEYLASSVYGNVEPFSNVKTTLINNPEAKKSADLFYRQALGVGAVSPDQLVHFGSGRPYALVRDVEGLVSSVSDNSGTPIELDKHDANGRHPHDYYSYVGNLRLVSRPIESMDAIKVKFRLNFIDLDPQTYLTTPSVYLNPQLSSGYYLEPGASLFLDYMEVRDVLSAAKIK